MTTTSTKLTMTAKDDKDNNKDDKDNNKDGNDNINTNQLAHSAF